MAYMSTNTGGTPTKAEDADANTKIQVEESADENKIRFDTAGSERMIIDETGKVGIGTSSPTEKLHLSDADGGEPAILIENTGTASGEPELIFFRSTTSPAVSMDIGHIKWKGKDDGGNVHNYASIFADMLDETGGTEDGRILFNVAKAGTDLVEFMRMGGTELTINEGGSDINFRVEATGEANLLFADAGNNRVGIGTATPVATLDVQGSARFRASVEVCTSDPAPANTETGTIYQFTKGSAGVFTLPASPPVGTQFVLVNGTTNDIVITRPHSSVKINGATSNATNTTAYAATSIVAVVSNGNNSEWLAFGGI